MESSHPSQRVATLLVYSWTDFVAYEHHGVTCHRLANRPERGLGMVLHPNDELTEATLHEVFC